MKLTNKYNLPQPLVDAIANDPYEFDGDISTTGLISPPQMRVLKLRHSRNLVEDVSDRIFALIGNNTHHILERINTPDTLKEARFYATVLGWRIGGQIDLYDCKECIHSDYKTTSVWSVLHGIKPEWEAQLNINSWLLTSEGFRVKKHQIVAILRDWSQHKAVKDHDYPERQVVVVQAPMWKNPRSYIEDRIRLHWSALHTPDDCLPECTPEERWERPPKYAVMKKGRKSAIKLFDTKKAAELYMKDRKFSGPSFYLEFRPGESVRCEKYCMVKPVCHQYHRAKGDETNG